MLRLINNSIVNTEAMGVIHVHVMCVKSSKFNLNLSLAVTFQLMNQNSEYNNYIINVQSSSEMRKSSLGHN